jgi:hypothetical protein
VTARIGFASALVMTLLGVVYMVFIGVLAATGRFVMPPSDGVQVFGGIVTIMSAPVMVALFACVAASAPADRRVLGIISLSFVILFAAMISINRYVQFAVVRRATILGEAGDLARFLPYDSASAMFALEMLGWGLFLGLAALAAAPLFGGGRLGLVIRWSFVVYGVLGLTSAVGHAIGNDTMTLVGFAAWGFVLYIATGLIAVYFKRLSAHALS